MSNKKLTFKNYSQENLNLPPLESLIPKRHMVRIVNDLVEDFELSSLESYYKSGGTSPYNPKMLLKVLIYGYCCGIYSSRKIADSLTENIMFMWLSGMQQPDFRTINNFRNRLDEVVKETFANVFDYLLDRGLIHFENYYVDGTKLEANANKHSWVWSKSVIKNKAKVKAKIEAIVAEIDRVNAAEDDEKVKKN
jgi:transposase